MKVKLRESDAKWLSQNLPSYEQVKDDCDRLLFDMNVLLAVHGFDDDYELTAFGRQLEAMCDRIYLDNRDKED